MVTSAKACEAVAAAANCEGHTAICGDAHDLLDIACRRSLHYRAWPAFNDGIVDATKAIILSVARINDSAVKTRACKIALPLRCQPLDFPVF